YTQMTARPRLGPSHVPIQKRPLSYSSRIFHSTPGCQQQIQHSTSDQHPAMATDLHDILPGIALWGTKISHQHLVDFTGSIMDFPEDNPTRIELRRRGHSPENPAQQRQCTWT